MKNIPIKAAWVSLVASSFVAILFSFALDGGNAAEAATEQESRTEQLAKETQNPVANLISVPFPVFRLRTIRGSLSRNSRKKQSESASGV